MAELWVGPGDLPHGASVSCRLKLNEWGAGQRKRKGEHVIPFQCLTCAALGLVIYDIKDFDSTVRGARCEALAVVIQLRVVLRDNCHFQ